MNQLFTKKRWPIVVCKRLLWKKENKRDSRKNDRIPKKIHIKIFSQQQHKTGDFWRKQEYRRYVFKTGASRSKRKSWNMGTGNTLKESGDECLFYENQKVNAIFEVQNYRKKVFEKLFWMIISHTDNNFCCISQLVYFKLYPLALIINTFSNYSLPVTVGLLCWKNIWFFWIYLTFIEIFIEKGMFPIF